MRTIESVCKELGTVDGVIGAFVLRQLDCLFTSLPPAYDTKRLAKVSDALSRLAQVSHKAGYDCIATAFHWQQASLLTWPIGNDALLGLLAAPTAVRENVELNVSLAIEDLSCMLSDRASPIPVNSTTSNATARSPAPQFDEARLSERLGGIERLLVEELGSAGKSLFERCRMRTPRDHASSSKWLLDLRNAVLGEIRDPVARVTIGTSVHWADTV